MNIAKRNANQLIFLFVTQKSPVTIAIADVV